VPGRHSDRLADEVERDRADQHARAEPHDEPDRAQADPHGDGDRAADDQ